MRKLTKTALAVAAIAAVSLGSYKAYRSYIVANMPEEDLLLAENVLALADMPTDVVLKQIAKHYVYKVQHKHVSYVYDTKHKKIGEYVDVKILSSYWQTCDRTYEKKYKNCESGICKDFECAKRCGYEHQQKPDVQEGRAYIPL